MSSKLSILICSLFSILLVFLGYQSQYFDIDASAQTLLTKDNKKYIFSQIIAERYNPEEFILIAIKPESEALFSPQHLNKIKKLSRELKTIKRVDQVNSLVNAPIFLQADLMNGNMGMEELSWEHQKFPQEFLEKNMKSHPLYEGLLFNDKQTALGIQVTFKTPLAVKKLESEIIKIQSKILEKKLNKEEQKKLTSLLKQKENENKKLEKARKSEIKQIKEILSRYQKTENIYMGGNNLLVYQLIKIIKNDLEVFGLAILAIVIFLLTLIFRQWSWVLTPILSCFVSIVMTMGLLGFFRLKVTVISANVISLQIILTLAIIIHLIEQFREIHRQQPEMNLNDKVKKMVREKIKPCFYAGLTTSIGFASLIFSGVQPVITFGWMMILAMTVTLSVGLILFPAMVRLLFKQNHPKDEVIWILKTMKGIGKLTNHFPKTILSLSVIITVGCGFGCLYLTAENSFLNYFDKDTDVYRELTFIDKEFGGSTPFDILYNIPKKEKDSKLLLTAEAVESVGKIHRYLEKQKEVGSVTSLYDFTTIARVVREKPMTEYELTFFVKMIGKKIRDQFVASYFSEKNNQVRISTRIKDSTPGFDREEFIKRLKLGIRDLGFKEKDFNFTGLFVLYQDILARLVQSQINTLALVYIAMILVLWLVFSSLKIALIAMIPNVMTTFITLGLMGFLNIPLDLMTMTIAAIAMGISVDDTIHYIHRYLEEIKSNEPDKATLLTHTSVGHALLYTTTIIVIGFGSMVFSNFVPSYYFGLLTGVAMLVALISDIVTLPVILHHFVKK